MKLTLSNKLSSLAIVSPLAAWNYWAGIVALFARHPSYLQVWAATVILVLPGFLTLSSESHKSLYSKLLQLASITAFFAWVIRLVGIMPNAPF